jgi:hypothetical protein
MQMKIPVERLVATPVVDAMAKRLKRDVARMAALVANPAMDAMAKRLKREDEQRDAIVAASAALPSAPQPDPTITINVI